VPGRGYNSVDRKNGKKGGVGQSRDGHEGRGKRPMGGCRGPKKEGENGQGGGAQ